MPSTIARLAHHTSKININDYKYYVRAIRMCTVRARKRNGNGDPQDRKKRNRNRKTKKRKKGKRKDGLIAEAGLQS